MGHPYFHSCPKVGVGGDLNCTGEHEAQSRETGSCSVFRAFRTPPHPVVPQSRAQPLRDWHLLSLYLICSGILLCKYPGVGGVYQFLNQDIASSRLNFCRRALSQILLQYLDFSSKNIMFLSWAPDLPYIRCCPDSCWSRPGVFLVPPGFKTSSCALVSPAGILQD